MNKFIDFLRDELISSLTYFLISIVIFLTSIYTLIQFYSYNGFFINYNNNYTMLSVRSTITLLAAVFFGIANFVKLIRIHRIRKAKSEDFKWNSARIFFRIAACLILLLALILTFYMKFIFMLEDWASSY